MGGASRTDNRGSSRKDTKKKSILSQSNKHLVTDFKDTNKSQNNRKVQKSRTVDFMTNEKN